MREILMVAGSDGKAGKKMHSGIVTDGKVVECYFPNFKTFVRNGALFLAAPNTLDALSAMVKVFNVDNIDPIEAFIAIEKAKAAIANATSK